MNSQFDIIPYYLYTLFQIKNPMTPWDKVGSKMMKNVTILICLTLLATVEGSNWTMTIEEILSNAGESHIRHHHQIHHHTMKDITGKRFVRQAIGKDSNGTAWPLKRSIDVEGDILLGGLHMVHERSSTITCGPIMPQGGVQAAEAMLHAIDYVNSVMAKEGRFIPGVKLGAHILDDCDKDTYGLEQAVDFIKGKFGIRF